LKEQVEELETELMMQINHPSFEMVKHLLRVDEKIAKKEILNEKKGHLSMINRLQASCENLQGTKTRAAIVDCINNYDSSAYEDEDEDDFTEELERALQQMMLRKRGGY
jgi:hypothetical protein